MIARQDIQKRIQARALASLPPEIQENQMKHERKQGLAQSARGRVLQLGWQLARRFYDFIWGYCIRDPDTSLSA